MRALLPAAVLFGALVFAATSAGCIRVDPYACIPPDLGSTDMVLGGASITPSPPQCARGARVGRCTDTNHGWFCAFPDDTCAETRLRWDTSAPEGLAARCATQTSFDLGTNDAGAER